MKFFITGGSGLIGQYLDRALSAKDEVVVYDLVSRLPEELLTRPTSLIRGDIKDRVGLIQAVGDTRPDFIIHLASLLAKESPASPNKATNIRPGVSTVLEAAKLFDVKRVVWASSGVKFAELNPANGLDAEGSVYSSINEYGRSSPLRELPSADHRNVDSVGLRFAYMAGLFQGSGMSGRIEKELIQRPTRGVPAIVPFGDELLSWLWMGDAARALVLAAQCDKSLAHEYDVGGDPRTLREAAEIVRGLLPLAKIEVEAGRLGLKGRLDAGRIEQDLGFYWEWPLEAQLGELIRQSEETISRA